MQNTKTARHTPEALVRTTVRLPASLHRAARIKAASEPGWTFQGIITDALRQFLGRRAGGVR